MTLKSRLVSAGVVLAVVSLTAACSASQRTDTSPAAQQQTAEPSAAPSQVAASAPAAATTPSADPPAPAQASGGSGCGNEDAIHASWKPEVWQYNHTTFPTADEPGFCAFYVSIIGGFGMDTGVMSEGAALGIGYGACQMLRVEGFPGIASDAHQWIANGTKNEPLIKAVAVADWSAVHYLCPGLLPVFTQGGPSSPTDTSWFVNRN